MAFYGDANNVHKTDKPDQYKKARKPGETPPYPGIYKCDTCGYEDVFNRECNKIPPCSKCGTKTTTWKFLVKATDK